MTRRDLWAIGYRVAARYGETPLTGSTVNRIFSAVAAASVLAFLAVAPVMAASCNGASHQITLSNGRAAPGSGPPGTPITFSVTYADSAGCAPTSVRVSIPGVGTYGMGASGTDYLGGTTFKTTLTLPAGRYGYSFVASSGSANGVKTQTLSAVDPLEVVIQAPTPAPTVAPTLPPTDPPPTVPPPPPTSGPIAPPAPRSTTGATPPPTQRPTDGSPPVRETASASSAASPGEGSSAPSSPPSQSASEITPVPTIRPGGTPGHANKADGGFGFSLSVPTPLLAYLVSTSAGIGFFFVLVSRRRPDAALALADGPTPTASIPARKPDRDDRPHYLATAGDGVDADPTEAALPRWLRPSLRDARRGSDPDRGRDRD